MSKNQNIVGISKNDIIETTIEDVNINGEGIGKWNEIAVFVPYSAIGDVLSVKIIKIQKKYLIGKIEKIIKSSPDRITSDCEVFGRCGGCTFRHISYDAELKIKQKHVSDCLQRIGGFKDIKINKICGAKEIIGYRNKAQIPLGYDKSGKIIYGFYASHSHNIINSKKCLLHPPVFDEIAQCVKNWAKDNKISVYNEITHRGLLRNIYIRCAKDAHEITICLVINGKILPNSREIINILTSKFKAVTGVIININTQNTNVVLGDKFVPIWGNEKIHDNLLGIELSISPAAFYQVNHSQTQKLYSIAKELLLLSGNETLMDLYCGAGTIGLVMANKAAHVVGVEVVPDAVNNARFNAKTNRIDNAEFLCGDASTAFESKNNYKKPDAVIIDPPRKGCSDETLKVLIKACPQKIVYISCNPATMATDLKKLCDEKYFVKEVTPVDLFPRTKHVECVVSLLKK